jgi:hypothetical protein
MIQFLWSFVPLGLIGSLAFEAGYRIEGGICLGASFAIAMAGYEIPKMELRRHYGTSTLAVGERVINIDAGGITSTLPTGSVQYKWQAYTRYRETDRLFALLISPYQVGTWIPKRVMSPEQIKELRELLKARLPNFK